MKRLMIFMGAALAVAVAKPELYKEKEDFQYSRSSTDEGSKSGFYGAQRGNMGGNYERAHNMDSLAQNQMSGLVRQVEGELGSGAKTRTGSVYTAANSRGVYGSGHYDLSNLAGRNFQEGVSYGDSHSQSSLASSSAYNAAGYTSSQSQNSRHSGYQSGGHTGINLQSDDLQTLDSTRGAGQHEYGGRQTGYSSGYNAQSGYQQHATYDTSNSNLQSGGYGSNVHTRLISATPVRIIVRPGTRVAIPVGAQTYIEQGALVNHNSLNSEAEVVSNANQRAVYRPSNAKHYESSYNYRKEWEKHDTIPATVASSTSTDNPFPKNSELYEDSQAQTSNAQYDARRVDSQRAHSSNVYDGYSASKTAFGQSNYDARRSGHSSYNNVNGYTATGSNRRDSTSDSRSNGYNVQAQYNTGRYGAAIDSNSLTQAAHNTGFNADLNSQVESLDTKPKSYQSSYSYHKSWERQGDPYVIKPASGAYYDGQSSQRLTSSSLNQGYVTGSHYQHSHQRGEDCDENGHIRVARSYNFDQFQDQQQQSQNLEDLGQQVEDFGQQVDNFDQQTGQQVEDLGQQTQTGWGQDEAGQQTQNLWDNVEDLSQQSHNQWDNMQQTWSKFEDFGQKPQDLNKQASSLDQKVQNDLGQRREGTELKNNTQDQQTHDIWDMGNIRQDDQEQASVFDQNLEKFHAIQSEYQNTQQSNMEQSHSNSQHSNGNFYNFHNEESSFHETHHESNQWHTHTASNSWDQIINTNINPHTPASNSPTKPLISIWDKLGTLEETLTNKLNKTEENNFSETQNTHGHSMRTDNYPKVEENVQDLVHPKHEKEISQDITNGTLNEHESSLDVGRGDISSEDLIDSKPYKHPIDTSVNMETTQNKNMQEGEKDSPQNDLSVLGLGPVVQKSNDHDDKDDKTVGQRNVNSLSENKHLTEQSHDFKEQRVIQSSGQEKEHLNETFEQDKELGDKKQQNEASTERIENKLITEFQNNERQNSLKPTPVHVTGQEENLEQQNLEDFSQQQNMDQQNLEHFFQKHNLDQQNLQDFGQQQNTEEQSLQDFAQHENMDQQNLQDFGQQQNTEEQSLQDFAQHENMEQQNLQDFGQQQNNEEQSLQDFGQQLDSQQQSLHNIWQQADLQQQNLHDLEHKENLDQHNLQDFGQQTDTQQQSLNNIWQQADLQQQNVHDLEHKENLDQQNLQDFGQQTDSQQQSLHNIWQLADLQPQNTHDLEHKENLEQQNLHDFDQQTDSQSLHNIWQQADLQQQNVHDFGQEQNLGPESINHNGRSNNYFEKQEQPPKELEEVVQVKKDNHDLQSISSSTVTPPVEPTTEKPGFWKSIGNKFKSAKDKVASWF